TGRLRPGLDRGDPAFHAGRHGDSTGHGGPPESGPQAGGAGVSTMRCPVRLGVNINDAVAETLRGVAKKRRISIREAVRRAVALLELFEKESAAGGRIRVVDREGHVREITLI